MNSSDSSSFETRPKKNSILSSLSSIFKPKTINATKTTFNDNDDLTLGYLLKLSQIILNKKIKSRASLPSKNNEHVIENIVKILNNQEIKLDSLKSICLEGIPDSCKEIRPVAWKLLLKILPPEKNKWYSFVDSMKIEYENLLEISFQKVNYKPQISSPKKNIFSNSTISFERSLELCKSNSNLDKTKEDDIEEDHRFLSNKYKLRKIADSNHEKFNKEATFNLTDPKKVDEKKPKEKNNIFTSFFHSKSRKMQDKSFESALDYEDKASINNFFKDQKLWDEIEKDTRRTRKSCPFFHLENTNYDHYPNLSKIKKNNNDYSESHLNTITRILFVLAKNNENIGYVQGMNELVAVIYYCFFNDENELFRQNSESATFFFLKELTRQLKDIFSFEIKAEKTNIEKNHACFINLLKKHEEKIYDHFNGLKLDTFFIFNKWVVVILAQEFEIDDILKIWDPFLAAENKLEFINFLILAVLIQIKDELLLKEFDECMVMLQKLPKNKLDIENIIFLANQLHRKEIEKN